MRYAVLMFILLVLYFVMIFRMGTKATDDNSFKTDDSCPVVVCPLKYQLDGVNTVCHMCRHTGPYSFGLSERQENPICYKKTTSTRLDSLYSKNTVFYLCHWYYESPTYD
jgi:hypothetical protein